jgi:ribokinase
VALKLGEYGALLFAGEQLLRLPALPVRAVDTVAAGDAFNAGLAVALVEGQPLTTAMRWAVAAGAVAVTRPGAQPAMPSRAEVLAMLEV